MIASTRPRFLLLMEDYNNMLTNTLEDQCKARALSYNQALEKASELPIFYGDSYLRALRHHGICAKQIFPLTFPLQYKWSLNRCRSPYMQILSRTPRQLRTRIITSRFLIKSFMNIATEQIKDFKPDILWVFSGVPLTKDIVNKWKQYTNHIILWWSCAILKEIPYNMFDLVITSIPSHKTYFEDAGVHSFYLPHAFDSRILDRIQPSESRSSRVVWAGSLSPFHKKRIAFLKKLSKKVSINLYNKWGEDYYSLFASATIGLHKNSDVGGNLAYSKRLFEITGMGACLVTEHSDHLSTLFEPQTEVVSYMSDEHCVEILKELLSNPNKAISIGKKGQERTLKDHSYDNRIRQLLERVSCL